jgi:chemotaxis protein methyltransferase CheR
MNGDEFDILSSLVKERSGLVLTRDKAYLLESRLLPVARKWQLKTLGDVAAAVRNRADSGLVRAVVEAMTTNESFFFRDVKPFDQFKSFVLPHLVRARAAARSIRIWSAACSSGQEPYSLAMILSEQRAQLAGWRIDILATDLSTEILDKAQAGLYSQFEVQRGLPIQFLVKYFKQQGERWQIDPAIRSMVHFKQVNLLDDMAALGRFDVIFCRNVLIYFDQPTKTLVLDRLSRQMAPDGHLYLGGAETVLGISARLQPVPDNRGIYSLASAAAPLVRAAAG